MVHVIPDYRHSQDRVIGLKTTILIADGKSNDIRAQRLGILQEKVGESS